MKKKFIKYDLPGRVLNSLRQIIDYQVKENSNNNEFGFFISILVILISYSR